MSAQPVSAEWLRPHDGRTSLTADERAKVARVWFFAALHQAGGFSDLRAFDAQKRDGTTRARGIAVAARNARSMEEFAAANAERDCYFGVAERLHANGRALRDCGALRALFVDIDFKNTPESEARASLATFQHQPSAVVHSGNGLHAYWFLCEPLDLRTEPGRAGAILKALARAVGGDEKAATPERILRVPGTLNHKYEQPRPVVLEYVETERRYALGEILGALGPVDVKQETKAAAPPAVTHGLAVEARVGQAREWLTKQLPAIEGDGGDLHTYTVCCSVAVGHDLDEEHAFAALTEWNARCEPPWEPDELRTKIGNAIKHATEPRGGKLEVKAASVVDGSAIVCEDPKPCAAPVVGSELLDEVRNILERFIVLPEHAAVTIALWCAYTHVFDAFDVSPILSIGSPTMKCGKTRLLSLLTGLVRRPAPWSNASPSVVFRSIDKERPTLLVDEFDGEKENEALRCVLNSGWTRKFARVARMVGEGANMQARQFSTWCPKVLAHIGRLAGTLEDRSIRVEMRRKLPSERVERARERKLDALLAPIASRIARFALDASDALANAEPAVPEALDDRAQDNWAPLLAIADAAGGEWPRLAREAALALSLDRVLDDTDSDRALLLISDVRDLIDAGKLNVEHGISAEEACKALCEMDEQQERPWRKYGEKGLQPVHFAALLRKYRLRSKQKHIGPEGRRFYPIDLFREVATRWLTPRVVPGRVPEAAPDDSVRVNPVESDISIDRTGVPGYRRFGTIDERSAQAPADVVAGVPGRTGEDPLPAPVREDDRQ